MSRTFGSGGSKSRTATSSGTGEIRIDHRSLKARGIEREPNIHLGPTAAAKERLGERTVLGDRHREIQARNAVCEQAKREIAGLERDIAAIDRAVREREAAPAAFGMRTARDLDKEAADHWRRRAAQGEAAVAKRDAAAEREETRPPEIAREKELRRAQREVLEEQAWADRGPAGYRALNITDVAY